MLWVLEIPKSQYLYEHASEPRKVLKDWYGWDMMWVCGNRKWYGKFSPTVSRRWPIREAYQSRSVSNYGTRVRRWFGKKDVNSGIWERYSRAAREEVLRWMSYRCAFGLVWSQPCEYQHQLAQAGEPSLLAFCAKHGGESQAHAGGWDQTML